MLLTHTVMLAALLLPLDALTEADARPTAKFRAEHVEIQKHLAHVDAWIAELPTQTAAQRRQTASRIVAFLDEHIRAHAKWEEAHLYPVIDRLAGSATAHRFTDSMRYEHGIIDRSISELEKLAASSRPDWRRFARRADRLLGVISAHFEKEEQVFLPLVDRNMTAEQFEKALNTTQIKSPAH